MNLKGTLLFLLFCVTAPAVGQFKNILLDGHGEGLCDPTVAINPRHPENIVIGAAPGHVYYSKDAGASWQKVKVASPPGAPYHSVVVDHKGTFYFFYLSGQVGEAGNDDSQQRQGILVHRSDNGGETWGQGEAVALHNAGDQYNERAAVDGKGNLFVSWTQFDRNGDSASACTSNILFSSSKNGKKWTDPVVISQIAGECLDNDSTAAGSVPTVTSDGKVMIAWANKGNIYLDRSFNGGDLWLSNDIVVAGQVGASDVKIPGHKRSSDLPVLMADKSKGPYAGSIYLVWADQRNGEEDTDIWFTRSHNFGDNWSTPARINDDGKDKHQYLPWLAVDKESGYLYIVYYDRRNHDDLQTDVYLAWSVDGGSSFKNMKISEKPFMPDEGQVFSDYAGIAAHKGIIIPVWTRMDDGKTSLWTTLIRHEDLIAPKPTTH